MSADRPTPNPSPVARWDDDDFTAPDLVWWAQLDGRYLVEVVRLPESTDQGHLRVFDHDQGNRLVLDERVGLIEGAAYGPAFEDVMAWQDRAIAAVDGSSA